MITRLAHVTENNQKLTKNQIMMLDILANNNWERPIYFTGGSYEDSEYIWMKNYLQLDGLVYKLVPIKTCHKGTSGGNVKGIRAQVTRNPSFTSCLRITEKVSSQIAPETKVMISIGNTYDIPKIKFSNIDLDTSVVAISLR